MDAKAVSDSGTYNALDWAAWGQRNGKDTTGVQELLEAHGAELPADGAESRPAAASSHSSHRHRSKDRGPHDASASCAAGLPASSAAHTSSTRAAASCHQAGLCGFQHNAACSAKRSGPLYDFFSAAHAGCLQCVKYYLEVTQLDVNAKSESGSYNALAWAVFGEEQGQHTQRVQGYLEAKGAVMPDPGHASTQPQPMQETVQAPLDEDQLQKMYGPGKKLFDAMMQTKSSQLKPATETPATSSDDESPRTTLQTPLSHEGPGTRRPHDRRGIGMGQ